MLGARDKGKSVVCAFRREFRAPERANTALLCSLGRLSTVPTVRGLLTWVVWLGVSACAGGQYEAQSAYGKTEESSAVAAVAPPMAPAATPAPYDPSSDGSPTWSADSDEGGEASGGGYAYTEAASGVPAPVVQREVSSSTQLSALDSRGEGADNATEPAGAQPAPGQVTVPVPPVVDKPSSETTQPLPKQLLLIYRAHLVLAVFETRATLDKIELLTRQLGGYLVSRSDDVIEVRVPVAKFEQALKDAAGLGDELSRQVTAEDVSDQYRDLKIRLRNAEAVRERLAALLARATNVKEALLVEEQLGRVTTTIEQIKGKLEVLNELIAFSTITVSLQPQASHEQLKPRVALPFPWLRELGLSNLLNLEAR